jgi:hypothetical protein
MDLGEIGSDGVDCIGGAQDRTLVNYRAPYSAGIFWSV